MTADPETLADLIALGRCEYCGTLSGIWHKMGCPRDKPPAEPVAAEQIDRDREAAMWPGDS